jgi:hypothetical protein
VNDRPRRLLAGSLLVLALAGCASGGAPATATPAPATTVTPTAPGEVIFPIRAAAQQPQACMDALIGGTLARSAASGLGITSADGKHTPVEWPFRYTAREDGGRVSLLDETGKVVAREGDEITIGGGFGNQLWHSCAPVTVTRAGG